MKACASAHYWGREIAELGHDVKLIAPIYVKPFVKRHSYQDTSLRYSNDDILATIKRICLRTLETVERQNEII